MVESEEPHCCDSSAEGCSVLVSVPIISGSCEEGVLATLFLRGVDAFVSECLGGAGIPDPLLFKDSGGGRGPIDVLFPSRDAVVWGIALAAAADSFVGVSPDRTIISFPLGDGP